jgi:flavin-dependent trigonelline monooxygenase, reductase component
MSMQQTHRMLENAMHEPIVERRFDTPEFRRAPGGLVTGVTVNFCLSQNAPDATGARAQVGAILEHRDGLVLLETKDGLQLPTGARLEPESDAASLRGVLAKLGLVAHLDFIFAVFESGNGPSASVQVYYRGRVVNSGAVWMDNAIHILPLPRIPWNALRDEAERSMLQRYVRERGDDAFGVYVGDTEAGQVQRLAAAR